MKQWDRVAIFGVGLMGGSIGLGLKKRGLADHVIGIGRNQRRLEKALERGAVDAITTDLAEGVRDAQLVVVCTPVECIVEHVQSIAGLAPAGALITDVGSTKANIVGGLADLEDVYFVGSHPLAGSEKDGVEAAQADLLKGRLVVVVDGEVADAVKTISSFWRSLDASVVQMTAAEHDEAVASVSHLPHIVASALAGGTPAKFLQLAATGWASSTRIAEGDPELWRQILTENRGNVLRALDNFAKVLTSFREALQEDDPSQLVGHLEAGRRNVQLWEQNRDTLGS